MSKTTKKTTTKKTTKATQEQKTDTNATVPQCVLHNASPARKAELGAEGVREARIGDLSRDFHYLIFSDVMYCEVPEALGILAIGHGDEVAAFGAIYFVRAKHVVDMCQQAGSRKVVLEAADKAKVRL